MAELTSEQIKSWKDLGVEILIRPEGDGDEFWLVSKYTEGDRLELTPEDFLAQQEAHLRVLEAFPDTPKKMSLYKPSKEGELNGPQKTENKSTSAKKGGHPF